MLSNLLVKILAEGFKALSFDILQVKCDSDYRYWW
jgi:hypothetical protein